MCSNSSSRNSVCLLSLTDLIQRVSLPAQRASTQLSVLILFCFQASEEYVHRPTILRHPESCERLQVGISWVQEQEHDRLLTSASGTFFLWLTYPSLLSFFRQILLQHVVDVSELCEVSPLDVDDGAVRHLWFTVVSQLRDGEVLLKTVCSLELLSSLRRKFQHTTKFLPV